MLKRASRRLMLLAATVTLLLPACTGSSAQQPPMPAPGDVVARVGSISITLAEVDARALQQSTGSFGSVRLLQALYEARRIAIDQLVADALLNQEAAARKLDPAALVAQEITAKVALPTDDDAAVWFGQNQQRLQGATLDQTRDAIKAFLLQERTLTARQEYLDELRSKASVEILLDAPRQVVAAAGRPAKGPDDAPVEIVEFSDFQCPYCLSAFPTVNRILATYGDQIRFVYRHYPLANHPRARPAAEASLCADEQGKFWPYHDRLFSNQELLSDADLKQHAAEVGLDAAQFNACYESRKYQADVDADIRAGDEAGVSGTPAFYINGRMLSGAQPFEVFQRLIDEELQRKR
jgi:protein-disulfide isomerase